MAAATSGQPTCLGCGSLLPWEDVDRVAGRCRTCDTAFDFTIPPATKLPVAPPPPPVTTATVGADVTFEVEVPAYTPKPPNLRVTRIAGASGDYRSAPTGDALDLRWEERRGGPLFLVTGSAMICGLGFATLLHQGNDTFLTFTFGSFAGLFAFLAIRLAFFFRGDTTISATSSEIRVVRSGGAASTMPVADLTDSVCWERAVRSGHVGEGDDATPIYRRVYDIAVVQGDGTRVVLAESAHKELAFHVVSLLRQHLIASRRVA